MSISLREISERIQYVDLYQDNMCCLRGTIVKDNNNNKRLSAFGWIELWDNNSSIAEKSITISNVTIKDDISFNGTLIVTETGSAADQVYGTYVGNNTFLIGIKQFNGLVPNCRLNLNITADIL